jgi:hypothetical protein
MAPEDPLSTLWRSAPTDGPPVADLGAIAARSTTLRRGSNRRNVRETFAGVLGVAIVLAFGAVAASSLLLQVGCVALVLGQIVVLGVLWRRGRPRPAPRLEAPTEDHLAYLRAELVRERNLLGSVWRWYLAPVLPGLLLVWGGILLQLSPYVPALWTWLNLVIMVVATVGIMALIARLHRRASEKLAREIEALDGVERT